MNSFDFILVYTVSYTTLKILPIFVSAILVSFLVCQTKLFQLLVKRTKKNKKCSSVCKNGKACSFRSLPDKEFCFRHQKI